MVKDGWLLADSIIFMRHSCRIMEGEEMLNQIHICHFHRIISHLKHLHMICVSFKIHKVSWLVLRFRVRTHVARRVAFNTKFLQFIKSIWGIVMLSAPESAGTERGVLVGSTDPLNWARTSWWFPFWFFFRSNYRFRFPLSSFDRFAAACTVGLWFLHSLFKLFSAYDSFLISYFLF